MAVYIYRPNGVCSREMRISYENDIITDVEIIGGCNGNLKGISSLVKGMRMSEVISRLEGIKCGFRATSCPDQLSKALKEIISK